jgi:hypothetical protein
MYLTLPLNTLSASGIRDETAGTVQRSFHHFETITRMLQNSAPISSASQYQAHRLITVSIHSDTMQYKLPTAALTVLLGCLAQAEANNNNNVKFCDRAAQEVKQSAFAAWYSVQASPSTQPVGTNLSTSRRNISLNRVLAAFSTRRQKISQGF